MAGGGGGKDKGAVCLDRINLGPCNKAQHVLLCSIGPGTMTHRCKPKATLHVADHCGNVLFKDGQPTFVDGNMALQNLIHKGMQCWHWLRRWFTLPPSQRLPVP